MSRQKKQGTAAETRIVKLHRSAGIEARRLAEGGLLDEGDIEVHPLHLFRVVGEVKDRERTEIASWLSIARMKAGTHRVALFVTQRIRLVGYQRRKAYRYVVIPEELWFELLSQPRHDPPGE